MLPIKTLIEDIDGLGSYLNGQVGWVPLEKAKKTIDGKLLDARKLDAMRRIGLLDRDGTNVRLTEDGRAYVSGELTQRVAIMRKAIRSIPLYFETIEWIHHSKVVNPTKTTVGNYWHDKHQDQLEGAQGAALTDAVIFFMRIAGEAGLGKFTRGAKARPDSYLKTDAAAIDAFINENKPSGQAAESQADAPEGDSSQALASAGTDPATPSARPHQQVTPTIDVSASPAVHVNIEIHIAADATAATVAEIFKNMRKYVLNNPNDSDA